MQEFQCSTEFVLGCGQLIPTIICDLACLRPLDLYQDSRESQFEGGSVVYVTQAIMGQDLRKSLYTNLKNTTR
jgi:hypothetical protein